MHHNITGFGERAQNVPHAEEHSLNVVGHFRFGIGAGRNVDLEPEAVEALAGQRCSPDKPVLWSNIANGNSRHSGVFVQVAFGCCRQRVGNRCRKRAIRFS